MFLVVRYLSVISSYLDIDWCNFVLGIDPILEDPGKTGTGCFDGVIISIESSPLAAHSV